MRLFATHDNKVMHKGHRDDNFRNVCLKLTLFCCVLLLLTACGKQTVANLSKATEPDKSGGLRTPSLLLDHEQRFSEEEPGTNAVALIETGVDALLSRIQLIRSAQTDIAMQTLIWADDEAGRLFMYELLKAAKRGVRVRFLIDHLSSERHIDVDPFLAYSHENFEIRLFNPVPSFFNQPKAKPLFLEKLYTLLFRFNRLNHRMHNKTFIVDSRVAITGGRNYQNAYYDLAPGLNYKDRDVLVIGPVVQEIAASFEDFWVSEYATPLNRLRDVRRAATGNDLRVFDREDFRLNGLLEWVNRELGTPEPAARFVDALQKVDSAYFISDRPGKRDRLLFWYGGDSEIAVHLATLVDEAKQSVTIQTPYLVLTSPAIALFYRIREERPDIDIRISTNSLAATDSWHVYALSYKQKQTYLQQLQFKIYEFMPRPGDMEHFMPGLRTPVITQGSQLSGAAGQPYLCLHGKSLVVDDEISFVGSYNLDPRSENINTEAGLFIRDRNFSRQLRAHIENDMSARNAWVVAPQKMPLGLNHPNAALAKLSDIVPLVDIWPFRYASSFQLKEGKTEVDPEHPDFYDSYEDVGSFPQVDLDDLGKELGARGTKAFLSIVKPLL